MSHFSQIVLGFVAIMALVTMVIAQGWTDAHATFYGDPKGRDTESEFKRIQFNHYFI